MPENSLLLTASECEPGYINSLEQAVYLSGGSTPEGIGELPGGGISGSGLVVINFESSGDGRGFSLARHLRLRLDYRGKLYAAGDIIPDQVRRAFDCGFDAVVVNPDQRRRHGEENWRHSGSRPGHLSYWSHSGANANHAWGSRARVGA